MVCANVIVGSTRGLLAQLSGADAVRRRPLAVLAKTSRGGAQRGTQVPGRLPRTPAAVGSPQGSEPSVIKPDGHRPSDDKARVSNLPRGRRRRVRQEDSIIRVDLVEEWLASLSMVDDSSLPFKFANVRVEGSLTDARRVARQVNEQRGSQLRIPTEEELLQIYDYLGDQLQYCYWWAWTETPNERFPAYFNLRRPSGRSRNEARPDTYFRGYVIWFVENR